MRHFSIVRFTASLRLWSCLGCIVALAASAAAHTEDRERRRFDIPADRADKTLKLFSEQSGHGVLVNTEAAEAVRTNAVKGDFAPRSALDRLLANTGLIATQDETNGAFVVYRESDDRDGQSQKAMRAIPNDPPVSARPSLPAASPTSGEEEVVKLPSFSVTGSSVDAYNAAEASSAARVASKLLDTPVTAYVITPAMVRDINPSVLLDMTNYFAGISPGRASGAQAPMNDRMTFRGFESFSRSVDNFSQALLPSEYANYDGFPSVFVDHAELIMGPDTIVSPTGTAGGTICAFTKSPQFTPSTDVSFEVGNYNANKVTVDSTGPIGDGKHMAFRVIAAYQDSQSYMPGKWVTWAGAAEFAYKFSDTAKFTIKYFADQEYCGGTVQAPGSDGEMVYTADTVGGATVSNTPQPGFVYCGWNGIATWNHSVQRDNMAEAELTAALTNRISMRLAANVLFAIDNSMRCLGSPVLTEKWDQNTGQEISVTPINPAALPEMCYVSWLRSTQVQLQNDYAGKFSAGGVSLMPVVGWAYQQGRFASMGCTDNQTLPLCDLAVGYYSPPVPPPSAFNTVGNLPGVAWTTQAYADLRAGFLNDRLFVTGGAARVWAGANDYVIPFVNEYGYNVGSGPVVDKTFSHTGIAGMPSVQPWHDTYIAGILGKVLPNVSVYYNYSSNAGLANELPEWQAGSQNEFGVKANFFDDRISVSADHFEIKENNVSYVNPAYNTGQSTINYFYTDLSSHGEEFNIIGGITKNLSVIGSYTNQKLRDHWDRRQRNIPDNMATLLLNYHFNIFSNNAAKNSNIFIGMIHQGAVAGETVAGFTSSGVPEQPGFYVRGFSVANAGAGYELGHYRFNLNVNNVLNERFWWQAQARSSLQPYPGICVTLTVTVHL